MYQSTKWGRQEASLVAIHFVPHSVICVEKPFELKEPPGLRFQCARCLFVPGKLSTFQSSTEVLYSETGQRRGRETGKI